MMTGDPRIVEDDVVIGIAADSDDPRTWRGRGLGPGHGNFHPQGDDVTGGDPRRRRNPFAIDVGAIR